MLKLSLNLSKISLNLSLMGRRVVREIKNVRSGSRVSRLFRHVFEHKSVKKVFGANLAVLIALNSFTPAKIVPIQAEETVIREADAPLTTVTDKIIQYPLESFTITQGFSFFHPGADFAAPMGTELKPIKDGVVEAVSHTAYGYGNAIIINHGDEISSLYAHLSKITVSVGDKVDVFTKIGEVGRSGHSTGPHLHLEIHNHGVPINPFAILPSSVSAI